MTDQPAYIIIGSKRRSQFIVQCDHASNRVPTCINGGDLGLPPEDMNRHIAYDIGALGLSTHLGALLDAPVVASNFSRLVIDPNRGEDDPTLLMRLYDGTIIPANRHADQAEKERRLTAFHRPYRQAARGLISKRQTPVILSIHSFTPKLQSRPARPWHVGVLFASDTRLSAPLIHELRSNTPHCIGINQPYSGALAGDTMDELALKHNHLHVLIELRNDLIETDQQQQKWAQELAPLIQSATQTATG